MAKFNFTIETDNLEEDIDKLVKTFTKAYTEVIETKKNSISATLDKILETEKGLDNRIDGIESRLSFCEVEKKETSKKDK